MIGLKAAESIDLGAAFAHRASALPRAYHAREAATAARIAGRSAAVAPSVVSDRPIAEKTIRMLKACVPAAVPGIAFLSGGQSDEEATAHLDAMNKIGGLPLALTFSYGRALQAAPQKAWSGKAENVAAGQRAFSHRARMNGLAALGKWQSELEKKAA